MNLPLTCQCLPNGWRYLRVGGTRRRHFDGISIKPRKLLENAPRRVPPPWPRRSLSGIGYTLCWAALISHDFVFTNAVHNKRVWRMANPSVPLE